MNGAEIFEMIPIIFQSVVAGLLGLVNSILSIWGSIGGMEGFDQLGGLAGIFELLIDSIWIF
ncbi:MAG: hypothetical protein JXR94_01310 [Candidatus Hydrogenedentes bacterium]|nr:hypothetical protein [Candidatus Hydrogenedentota bacterium]